MYQIQKHKSFYTSLKMLRYICAIPKESNSTGYLMKFRMFYSLTRLACFVTFVVMPCGHMMLNIRENTGVDISEDLSTMVGGFGAILITTSFFLLRKQWIQIFLDLEHINWHGRQSDFENLAKKLNFRSSLYGVYTILAIITYAIVAATETSYCKNINQEKGLHEMCGYFTPIVLPFDGSSPFIRVPIFGLQMVLALFTFTPAALICFLIYEVVETVSFHLEQIKEYYLNAFQDASKGEIRARLRFCVYYHIKILSLCERFSILEKYTTGSFCIICALIFATIGNFMMKTKPLAGLCYLIGYVVALFLPCHGGQRLMDETCSVLHAVYDSKWYETDVQTMRNACFILARSQRPIVLNGFPFGVMNYPMFLMIVKTSYTYLMLLNQST